MGLMDVIRSAHEGETLKAHLEMYTGGLEAKPSNRADGWHPSSFCDMCPRQNVLQAFHKVEDKPWKVDAKLRRIFDVGTAQHAWYHDKYFGPMGVLWGRWKCSRCHEVQWGFMPKERHHCSVVHQDNNQCYSTCYDHGDNRFSDSKIEARGGCNHCGIWGEWIYKEIPVEKKFIVDGKEHVVVGHSDGLVSMTPWSMKGPWFTLEMKTINDRGFWGLSDARDGHMKQAMIYNRLIQLKFVPGVPDDLELPYPEKGILLYLGKNTSDVKEYPLEPAIAESDKLIANPELVEQAIADKVLPPRHDECHSSFATRAKGCVVVTHCFQKDEDDENLRIDMEGG